MSSSESSKSGTGGTDYYEILEVATDAAPHEIHKAYQRAKSTYSSENPALYTMFSAEEAHELLRLIEEAYLVLGNPSARRAYDEARIRGESMPNTVLEQIATSPSSAMSPTHNPSPSQIASAHQALPDFATPPESSNDPAPASSSKTLPPGTGRTLLSTYKIDETFEGELQNTNDFDGGMLQRVRLYKNISIDRMSEATRISRTYLTAVETNDFKSLPAAVYVRGFIVQMARILGLEDQKVASSYIKIFRAGGGK